MQQSSIATNTQFKQHCDLYLVEALELLNHETFRSILPSSAHKAQS